MDPALLALSIPSDSNPLENETTINNINTETNENRTHIDENDKNKSRGNRGKNWTIPEDHQLCISWGDISMDLVVGTQQKRESYWNLIHENYIKFKEKLLTDFPRNVNSLKHRWEKISPAVTKFANNYAQAERRVRSGQVAEDVLRFAKDLYQEETGDEFAFEHCWVILRNCDKWKDIPVMNEGKLTSTKKNPRKRTLPSSNPTSGDDSFIELDQNENNEDAYTMTSLSKRPIGTKAAKNARKTRDEDHPSSNAQIEDINKSNRALATANESKAAALRKIAEVKIMSQDPKGMEGDRREYYLMKQRNVLARYKASKNSGDQI